MTSPVTIDVLRERQGWTLAQKIDHSLGVIDQFVSRMGGRCFVSCSFGKDSLVTLDLVRMILPGVKAVWVNTGVEHPSVVRLANRRISEGDNVTVLRPEMTFREVVEKYGFPLVSKETAYKISQIRRNPDCGSSRKFMEDRDSKFCLPKRWMWLVGEDFDTSDKCCSVLKKRPMRKYIRSSGLAPILGTMASESEMRKGHYVRNGGCNVWNSTAVPLPPPI